MRALLRDVGHVDHGVIEPMAIEHLAARAPHEGRWRLRRQLLAGLPHRLFPRDRGARDGGSSNATSDLLATCKLLRQIFCAPSVESIEIVFSRRQKLAVLDFVI